MAFFPLWNSKKLKERKKKSNSRRVIWPTEPSERLPRRIPIRHIDGARVERNDTWRSALINRRISSILGFLSLNILTFLPFYKNLSPTHFRSA